MGPKAGSNKPKKMSMAEFLEMPSTAPEPYAPGSATGSSLRSSEYTLPTRPRERGPEDDGSFQRRSYNTNDTGISNSRGGTGSSYGRGDNDNWRRANMGDSATSASFEARSYNRPSAFGGGDSGPRYNKPYTQQNDRSTFPGGRGGGLDRGLSGYSNRDSNQISDRRFGHASEESIMGSTGTASMERPRLSLAKRTVDIPESKKKEVSDDSIENEPTLAKGKINPFGSATAIDTASKLAALDLKSKENISGGEVESFIAPLNNISTKTEDTGEFTAQDSSQTKIANNTNSGERKQEREESNDTVEHSDVSKLNERARHLGRGEGKIDEQRDHRDRTRRAGDLRVNSRASLLGETALGNRDTFREDNMSRRDMRDREPFVGPNDRFNKYPEDDRRKLEREERRFDKVAHAQSSVRVDNISLAPLVPQNSRFAKASAEYEAEQKQSTRAREDRRIMKEENFGPAPLPSNSRFAAALAELEVEKEKEREERRLTRDKDENFLSASSRFNPPFDDRRGNKDFRERDQTNRSEFGMQGRFRHDHGVKGDEIKGRHGKSPTMSETNLFPPLGAPIAQRTDFIRPELPKHLQPKKEPEPVLPPVSAPIALPGEDEEAARARIDKKKREAEEKALAEKKLADELAAKKAAEDALAAEKAAVAAAVADKLLAEFIHGGKVGNELAVWCKEQGSLLPSVENLVFHLLQEKEKKNPNPACPWAEKDKYGSALMCLVQDNIEGQVGILWGVQKYCDKQGFPKIDGEYLVQSMFRSMYKYDLADAEAFTEWKEDESENHQDGKVKSVIQTVEWFNWLEQEDNDGEEDEDYEDDDG